MKADIAMIRAGGMLGFGLFIGVMTAFSAFDLAHSAIAFVVAMF
jgi:hypothetical protein